MYIEYNLIFLNYIYKIYNI